MAEKIYQIKGDLVHFNCLTNFEKSSIEIIGTEVDPKTLDENDTCYVCGEQTPLNGDAEPSQLEKEDDND